MVATSVVSTRRASRGVNRHMRRISRSRTHRLFHNGGRTGLLNGCDSRATLRANMLLRSMDLIGIHSGWVHTHFAVLM